MTGQRTYETDHGTSGRRTSIGPNPMGIDRVRELRARQSAERRDRMAERIAAMTASQTARATRRANRDAKRWAPESNDADGIAWILYSAKLTD